MSDKELKKDLDVNKKVDVTCGECKRSTKHLVLSNINVSDSEEAWQGNYISWFNDYQIVQCQGCETISFRKVHENSEEFYPVGNSDYEYVQSIDIYPNPEEGRNAVEDDYLLPNNLQRIYTETIKSINSGLPILTGVGIRAIVETVCEDKKVNGNDLYQKINDLVTQGVLTKDGADILHKLRILGNKAAHEVKPHDNVQLGLALDVIDHLLQGVYILPYHAKKKFK